MSTNNSTPAERMRGLVWTDKLINNQTVVDNDGTKTNAPVINNGATFVDGSSQRIQYPNLRTMNPQGDFTVMCWWTPATGYAAANPGGVISTWGAGGAGNASYRLLVGTSGIPGASVYDGTSSTTVNNTSFGALTVGTKYLLGFTFTLGTTTLQTYANGIAGTSSAISVTPQFSSAYDMILAKDGADAASNFAYGVMEDPKIFNQALTTQEMLDYYNNATYDYVNQAVLDLPCDMERHDPTNTRTTDISPNGLNGTLTGTALTKNTTEWGYNLPGTDEFIDIGDTSQNVKSVSFWVKPNSDTEEMIDLDGGTHTIEITSGSASATGFVSASGYIDGKSGNTVVAGTWQHIVVTTETAIDANDVDIGRISTTYLTGDIARFKMWTTAITPLQVADLFQRELQQFNNL